MRKINHMLFVILCLGALSPLYACSSDHDDEGTNQDRHDASIKLFHKMVVQTAIESEMVPMVWDINVASQQGTNGVMTILDRSRLAVFGKPAMQGITEGTAAAKWYSPAKKMARE